MKLYALPYVVSCAFVAGCSGRFDTPAGDADPTTTHDAARSATADEDAEGGLRFDAGEPANDPVDAPSERTQGQPASDAGASLDVAPQLVADAVTRDDAAHQANDGGAAEAGNAWTGSDTSTPPDQGATSDGAVALPTIDSGPPDETWCGNQIFATTTTIDIAKTVAICAGSVLTFGPSASLVVQGTLLAQGTANMPIRFVGQQENAGAWGGVTVYAGGAAVLTNTEIHDATIAFSTAVSGKYSLDHVVLGNSNLLLHLMSAGTIAHATMHALGDLQSTIGDAVVIDDASPYIVDSTADNGSTGADLIQVNGPTSAPTFERMDVSGSHCAFHFNASTNATIKNSYLHDTSYGLMVVYGAESVLTGNNFERNVVALGLCLGGTVTFRGNYVDGAFADSSCSALQNEAPAVSAIPGVGPGP